MTTIPNFLTIILDQNYNKSSFWIKTRLRQSSGLPFSNISYIWIIVALETKPTYHLVLEMGQVLVLELTSPELCRDDCKIEHII